MYLYIPATFDIATFPTLSGHEDEVHWWLHKTIVGAMFRRHDVDHDGLTPIHSTTVRRYVRPNHVKHVRNELVDNRVIVWDESYRRQTPEAEGFSQGYGLHPDYAGGLRRVEVQSSAIARRIKADRILTRLRDETDEERQATRDWLLSCLRKVNIDKDAAYLATLGMSDEPILKEVKVGPRGRRRIIKTAMASPRALTRMTVDRIASGELDYRECPYGRQHNPFTRLASECRAALNIKGRPLASIDIRNSQLVFTLLLMMADMAPKATNRKPRETPTDHTHPMLYSLIRGDLSEDGERFRSDVLDGSIYDKLMVDTGIADRAAFKGQFFRDVLYGDNEAHYSRTSAITAEFVSRYPTVWDWIIRTKKFRGAGLGADAFKQLARDMQRAESNLVIGKVCGRLARTFPHVTVVTIHDSIMCLPEHMPLVERVLIEEFERTGVRPTFKVDPPASARRVAA